MTIECPLEMTSEEWEEAQDHEAIVVREFEREEDGSRFGKVMAWGTEEEMSELAEQVVTCIIPVGVKAIGHTVVKIEDLIGP